jgi:hypothetical protein
MKQKFYTMHGTAIDKNGEEHIVTMVGEYLQTKETEVISELANDVLKANGCDFGLEFKDNAILSVPMTKKVRILTYAFSICHPDDIFDENIGIEIAKRRIKEHPLGQLKTEMITTLCTDQVKFILFGELKYVMDNIDKFINENN